MPRNTTRERPAPPAPEAACKYCATKDGPVRLVPPDGGEAVHVCSRCLRSLLLRKADITERRNGLILEAFAEENGLQVLFAQGVGYALPPLPSR